MKKIKYSLVVFAFSLLLAACQTLSPPTQEGCSTADGEYSSCDETDLGSNPSIPEHKDWNKIFPLFVKKLQQSAYLYKGNGILLIGDIQNRSNENIDILLIENIFHNSMLSQNVFTPVDEDEIIEGKQRIGISVTDRIMSRSKTIALAKSVNADYVLFTTIYRAPDEEEDADLSMELLYTKTGEIIRRMTSAQLFSQGKSSINQGPLRIVPTQPKPIQLIPGIN